MTQTSQSQSLGTSTTQITTAYSCECECLVNSKIPFSLFPKLETRLRRHLLGKHATASNSDSMDLLQDDQVLAATIESMRISEESITDTQSKVDSSTTDTSAPTIKVFLYKYPISNGPSQDQYFKDSKTRSLLNETEAPPDSSDFYSIEMFPNSSSRGLWESLQFDSTVKSSILAYMTAIFRFSLLGLTESNEISFNRILLLHGPPGTGKTTLAKALVFKLSTRLYSLQNHSISNSKSSGKPADISADSESHSQSSLSIPLYDRLLCLTLNSSQLFSRFFSESAKSVQKVFQCIRELAQQPGNFVCVLIDEVETLAMSRRQSAGAGSSEPTDSVRAVNTLLTQIDQLRSFPNILYITTSNYPSLVDSAFIDRIDWSFEIGLPSEKIIYALIVGSVRAMRIKGLVKGTEELASSAQAAQLIGGQSNNLLDICTSLKGQSGRAIKRLPLMAYASFLQKYPNSHHITIPQFIHCLNDLVKKDQ